ncbi:MAG: ABC transporter substrate-binding protein [Pseudomonadota bacterium]
MRHFVVLLLCMVMLSACSSRDDELVLSTNNWMGYLPLYLARDAGYYDDIPLHLVQLPSNTETMRSFRNGMVTAAGLTLDEALLLAESGVEVCIPLIMDYSDGADAIIARAGVTDMAQLEGLRVGVENTAVGAHMLTRGLEMAGLGISDITVVPLEVHEHLSAFERERVDAVVTFDPVRSQLLGRGANQVFSSAEIPGEITDVLVVNRSYLKRYPDHISTLIEGWFRLVERLGASPEGALQRRFADYSGLDPASVERVLGEMEFPGLEANRTILQDEGAPFRRMAQRMNATMLEQKVIGSRIDVERLLCPTDRLTVYH